MLISACMTLGAWAQFNVSGPGFLPDENGTNLDAPRAGKVTPNASTGTVIKDCSECPEMVLVDAGGFMMGSNAQEQEVANQSGLKTEFTTPEAPQHYVRVTRFAAGRYQVTKGEFAAFVRSSGYRTEAEQGDGCHMWTGKEWKKDAAYNWRNVGFAQGDDHPVVCVSWNDAQAYIQWLNGISGKSYRLLSEAEREYAARGGKQTAFWWGESITTSQANYQGSASYNGRQTGQFRQTTVPVNSFSPNPFGLYNVHGNVWEWTQDCWHENYDRAPTDGSAWTINCSGSPRVLRGGSWNDGPQNLRSASRSKDRPEFRFYDIGFRLASDFYVKAKDTGGPPKLAKKMPETPRFEYTYFQLEREFLVNLNRSGKVMAVQIAIMTRYDERVIENIKKHEFALRSAILDVLRMTTEADLAKPDFRRNLAQKVADVMNAVLEKYEDFGGVEEVNFTSFIVQ